MDRSPETKEPVSDEKKEVIQIGSYQNVVDTTGQFHKAQAHVVGISQTGKNETENMAATLRGERLLREIREQIAGGSRNIYLDFSRAENLSSEDFDALMELRDMYQPKGVRFTIMGLTADEDLRMRAAGVKQKGLEGFTKLRTEDALQKEEEQPQRTETAVDLAA